MKAFILSLLLIQALSQDDPENTQKSVMDSQKCSEANSLGAQISPSTCHNIEKDFQATGNLKGQCCYINANLDPLYSHKFVYHEQWKEKLCQLYGLTTNCSEEELRKMLSGSSINTLCMHFTEFQKKWSLYSMALRTLDKKITYDCGEGETTMSTTDFYASSEEDKFSKDSADCMDQYTEKTCQKMGSKVLSDNSQCCWCETQYLNSAMSAANSQTCQGFEIAHFKDYFQNMKISYSIAQIQLLYSCNCVDKTGKQRKGSLNTSTGEIEIS